MFNLKFWGKEKRALLSPEDIAELAKIEKESYMTTAKELVKKRGQQKATKEIVIEGANPW